METGSCDEEKVYFLILEKAELGESIEMPRTGCDYEIPRSSLEVRPRSFSPEQLVNTSSNSIKIGA